MKIAVGADHAGWGRKESLKGVLEERGLEIVDVGTDGEASVDYPDFAFEVGRRVAAGEAGLGLLVCGSGIGMSISANKVNGVRAALCHDDVTAEMSRRHNDANVLCLPADLLGRRLIENIVHIWLDTEFEGGRHARRVGKITAIETGQNPAESGDQ